MVTDAFRRSLLSFRCAAPGCISPVIRIAPLTTRLLSVCFFTGYLFRSKPLSQLLELVYVVCIFLSSLSCFLFKILIFDQIITICSRSGKTVASFIFRMTVMAFDPVKLNHMRLFRGEKPFLQLYLTGTDQRFQTRDRCHQLHPIVGGLYIALT